MLEIDRIFRVEGTPYAIGHALGRRIGPRLERIITAYIEQGPSAYGGVDADRLARETASWFDGLPDRYRQEMSGLADGAGIPVRRVAEWTYVEACTAPGCSSVLLTVTGHTWVARNNDIWAPDLWGYVTIREPADRIPTLSIGMPGETFTATGVNREKLWLHYHYLLTPTAIPSPDGAWFEFQWMTEALETCSSLADVCAWLNRQPRRGSMVLFAVDGKTDERAVLECLPGSHQRWPDDGFAIAATNHSLFDDPEGDSDSHQRRVALQRRLSEPAATVIDDPADTLRSLLADPAVEQHRPGYGTVYSAVACPATGIVWTTLGGFPAASHGAWESIAW